MRVFPPLQPLCKKYVSALSELLGKCWVKSTRSLIHLFSPRSTVDTAWVTKVLTTPGGAPTPEEKSDKCPADCKEPTVKAGQSPLLAGHCTLWASKPLHGQRYCGDGDPATNPVAANYTEGGTDCKACRSHPAPGRGAPTPSSSASPPTPVTTTTTVAGVTTTTTAKPVKQMRKVVKFKKIGGKKNDCEATTGINNIGKYGNATRSYDRSLRTLVEDASSLARRNTSALLCNR